MEVEVVILVVGREAVGKEVVGERETLILKSYLEVYLRRVEAEERVAEKVAVDTDHHLQVNTARHRAVTVHRKTVTDPLQHLVTAHLLTATEPRPVATNHRQAHRMDPLLHLDIHLQVLDIHHPVLDIHHPVLDIRHQVLDTLLHPLVINHLPVPGINPPQVHLISLPQQHQAHHTNQRLLLPVHHTPLHHLRRMQPPLHQVHHMSLLQVPRMDHHQARPTGLHQVHLMVPHQATHMEPLLLHHPMEEEDNLNWSTTAISSLFLLLHNMHKLNITTGFLRCIKVTINKYRLLYVST